MREGERERDWIVCVYSERAKERVGGDREKKRYIAKKIHTVHGI